MQPCPQCGSRNRTPILTSTKTGLTWYKCEDCIRAAGRRPTDIRYESGLAIVRIPLTDSLFRKQLLVNIRVRGLAGAYDIIEKWTGHPLQRDQCCGLTVASDLTFVILELRRPDIPILEALSVHSEVVITKDAESIKLRACNGQLIGEISLRAIEGAPLEASTAPPQVPEE